MSKQEQTLELLKKFLFEMAMRIATLEKLLLEKQVISEKELAETEEEINKEANSILNNG